MKLYFYSVNQEKIGPITLEELSRKNLTKDVLVWRDGLADWVHASELDELKEVIIKDPPPLPYKELEFNIIEPDSLFDKTHDRDIKGFFIFLGAIIITPAISLLTSSLLSTSVERVIIIYGILLSIVSIVYTITKSEELNRDSTGWAFFAIILPIISALIVSISRRRLYNSEYIDEDNYTKSQINLEIAKDYYEEELYDEAIYFVNIALKFEPKNKEALFLRGEIYYQLNRLNKATWDIESCLDQGYIKNRTYKLLSEIYAKKGDLEKSDYYKKLN